MKTALFNSKIAKLLQITGVIAVSLSFATSCSKGEESDLKVSFPGGLTYALPVAATSCASPEPNDLPKNSIAYKNVTINWTHASDSVYVIAMKLEFKSANLDGGAYSCTIAGDELSRIFAHATTGVAWNGVLTAGQSITNSCNVKCGGVKFAEGLPSTTALGTVTLIGIQRNPTTEEEKPIKGSGSIKLTYGGL